MLEIASSTASDLVDTLVGGIPGMFTVIIPFVVGIVLFMIAKKWFFGGVRRV